MDRPFRDLSPAQSYFCDVLRFLAALAVAVHHSLDQVEITAYESFTRSFHTNLGSIGVMMFFLLSGFLITHTAGRKSANGAYTFKQYFIERSVRIYLVFVPAIILAALVAPLFQGRGIELGAFSIERFVTNLFMLQGIPPFSEHASTFALMGPSWTLNYEFWFYMLFGLAALPPSTERRWSALAGIVIFAIAFLIMRLEYAVIMGATWLAGALAAVAFQRVRIPLLASLPIAAAALVSAPFLREHFPAANEPITTATFAIAFGALMLSFNDSPGAKSPSKSIAHHLAAYSYSLYITQMIWFYLVMQLIRPQIMALGAIHELAPALAVLLIANLGAFLFALCTEAHNDTVRRWLLRVFDTPPPAGSKSWWGNLWRTR